MIELITGRSGSGKSELLYRYIREKCADKAILIVPEQSSFYNEKKLIDDLGDKIAGRIEVLSFRRLCSNIMEEHKADAGKRIDDGVKAVLMSMAIEKAPSEGGELELYTKKGKKGLKKTMDLVDPMLIAVNEYKMCLISRNSFLLRQNVLTVYSFHQSFVTAQGYMPHIMLCWKIHMRILMMIL